MVSLFLGLTSANLTVLLIVFGVGLGAVDASNHATTWYGYHIALAIFAGMLAVGTHVATYMYFMATSKWLEAAADKANLPTPEFVVPAFGNKRRSLLPVMTAIIMVMLTMFAGAAADPTVRPWWPAQVHLLMAAAAIGVNALCAIVEFRLIRQQGTLMDRALAVLNNTPGVVIESV